MTDRYECVAWLDAPPPSNPFFAESAVATSCGPLWDSVVPTAVGKVGVAEGGDEFSRLKKGCCRALNGFILESGS